MSDLHNHTSVCGKFIIFYKCNEYNLFTVEYDITCQKLMFFKSLVNYNVATIKQFF